MKICEKLNHRDAEKILLSKGSLLREVTNIVQDSNLKFGRDNPQRIKSLIADKFNQKGWADRVKVSEKTNLTINFMKSRVGVCFQLGNVARIYADLLKLQALGRSGKIDVGVIIVADGHESKLLGANYASYDRLKKEMQVFSEIINIPILIISLSN
jgi:hypothetical protein